MATSFALNEKRRAFRMLGRVLHRLTGLPLEALGKIEEVFQPVVMERGDYFQRSGDRPLHTAFVSEGLFRSFYYTDNGKEYITNFHRSGHFLGNYSAMLRGQARTRLNIAALENSRVLLLPFDTMHSLMERDAAWERFGRRAAENLFIEKEDRERELLLLSAEERYLLFRKSPLRRMEERIPHYHIASYLGITPVGLSRIRTRLKKSGQI